MAYEPMSSINRPRLTTPVVLLGEYQSPRNEAPSIDFESP